jgi:hypothetical protein
MKNRNPGGISRYAGVLILLVILSACMLPVTATPLTSNRHIFINVANDAGVKFGLDSARYGGPANTYYIKADGGGLNELHITNDLNDAYGQVTTTSAQSGVFYLTNTGGRGFDNDIILLLAVREPVPDDFSIQIKSSGYTWTPAPSGAYTPVPPTDYSHVSGAVSETFTKSDFIYGPQNWKPGPGTLGDLSLPIFNGQDMSDTTDKYQLMFIDLKAGNMYPAKFPGATLADNGAVKVEYSFTGLRTFASFSGYGWCSAANQDQGISWTNPTKDFDANGGNKQSGQSGFSVTGVTASPSHSGGGGGGGISGSGSAVPLNPVTYYKGQTVSTFSTGTINGSLRFFSDPDAGPVLANNRIRNFNISVDVPPGSNITLARMYLYISGSQFIQGGKGVAPSFYTQLNTTFLEPDKVYIDADGDVREQIAETCAYDVRDLLKGNGTYTFSIRNLDQGQVFTIDKVLLVAAYEHENATPVSYWINEGCDVVLSQPEKGLFPEDTVTSYSFSDAVNMSTARDAFLYLFSTGLDQDNTTEHTVSFNEGKWYNIFDNWSIPDNSSDIDNNKTCSVTHLPVSAYLNETYNKATVQSSIRKLNADYLVNRNAFLIVENNGTNSSAVVQNITMFENVLNASPSDTGDPSLSMNESRSCRISLDSDPEGALVYVDGTYSGKTTPDILEVMTGENHTVRFELDGYAPSETLFTATNTTSIRTSLYTAVHSTKGRLAGVPEDPDGIRYGGLYIHSRPNGATISINGISTGKTTPAVFMGLNPGSYTVNLGRLRDTSVLDNSMFVFEDQTVWVLPDVITPVDINGIGAHVLTDAIVDSHHYRGIPFTVNGYVNNRTIPAKISTTLLNSFVTIHENASFISYPVPVPVVMTADRYLLFEPRDHQDLSISVNSSPRGAAIFIDGFSTGYATPYTFTNISDGLHRITVTRDGYLPKQSLIDLPRRSVPISTTDVDFILEEFPSGFLYVNSIPEGGTIAIDGMTSGEVTPALFKSIPTGTHEVKVTWTNATKAFYDITVNSLAMTNLTADFTPEED